MQRSLRPGVETARGEQNAPSGAAQRRTPRPSQRCRTATSALTLRRGSYITSTERGVFQDGWEG